MGKKRSATTKDPSKNFKAGENNDFIWVDPQRVRFQHSRIRPYFSSCGRALTDTLESIRRREITPDDLPPIQVMKGPETEDGFWYFSLNNRRLWVLKRCREEGLLENNLIRVRVRRPKSSAETARYCVEKCAIDAKIMKEFPSSETKEKRPAAESVQNCSNSPRDNICEEFDQLSCGSCSEDEDDLSFTASSSTNRFSVLF